MAGGAKETPRQKMIGMMYLVLTALLALQVSNTVLDKFVFIDESLKQSVQQTLENNGKILSGIEATVEKNGSRSRDVAVMEKAKKARELTSNLLNFLGEIRDNVIEVSGGVNPETGEYNGAKDYDKQMNYTLGPEGSKSGVAYELQRRMNDFAQQMSALHDSLNLDPLAKDAKDIPIFARNPDQRTKDFAQLNFGNTPTVAALAILSQMKAEIANVESKVLETLAKDVGADQLRFDKIVAVVKPKSQIVAAGTKYEAEMFIAASSSNATPRMTYNGAPIKVVDGSGMVEFVATPGDYDAEGNAKKKWVGTITIPTPFGDSTFKVEEEYIVAKPVIQIQAAAVSALYLNCGNEINVQVPALGATYDPTFTATGAESIKGAKKGLVTLVPSDKLVKLSVYSSGNLIGTEEFKVKAVPRPTIALADGGNNRPLDLKNGVDAAQMPRSLAVRALPDDDFKSFLPNDARYRVTQWEVTLARGKRGVNTKKVTAEKIDISDLASQAKPGDRIVVEVKQVLRMNFKGNTEPVGGISGEVFTLSLN